MLSAQALDVILGIAERDDRADVDAGPLHRIGAKAGVGDPALFEQVVRLRLEAGGHVDEEVPDPVFVLVSAAAEDHAQIRAISGPTAVSTSATSRISSAAETTTMSG